MWWTMQNKINSSYYWNKATYFNAWFMRSQKINKREVDIQDVYSLKISALWAEFKKSHISFWFLCIYFFFEYVRPHNLYPVLDVLPWGQMFLLLTVFTAFLNRSISWVSNPLNKLFILFAIIIVLSGIFAFRPADAWADKETMLGWLIVYFLVINIVNTE